MSYELQPRLGSAHGASSIPAPGGPGIRPIRPPRPFKFTRYSLYIILATFGFGLSKAIYAYMGDSVVPTTLEFVFGVVFAIGMYWISLYEPVEPKRFSFFLHDSLSLWGAVQESILAYFSVVYIYGYFRLLREPQGHVHVVLRLFSAGASTLSGLYILLQAAIPTFRPEDPLIVYLFTWTMCFLVFLLVFKDAGLGFTSFLRVLALLSSATVLLLGIQWIGALCLFREDTPLSGRNRSNLWEFLFACIFTVLGLIGCVFTVPSALSVLF